MIMIMTKSIASTLLFSGYWKLIRLSVVVVVVHLLAYTMQTQLLIIDDDGDDDDDQKQMCRHD